MITDVWCDIGNVLVYIKSIYGLTPELTPKLTTMHGEETESNVMVLTIPSDKVVDAKKIEIDIEYGIYLNESDELFSEVEGDNEDADDILSRKKFNLDDFSLEDQQTIFNIIKKQASDYVDFCKNEVEYPNDDCSYVRTQIKNDSIVVTNMNIQIEFNNCDLRKVVKGINTELCSGFFDAPIDHVKLKKGIYDIIAYIGNE